MGGDTKLIIGAGLVTAVLIIGAVILLSGKQAPEPESHTIPNNQLIRDEGYNTLGPDNAPITIVEFADFNCPACKTLAPVLKQLTAEYPSQVKFIYRHFPLPQYPDSQLAAQAAEAAGYQNKFWEMYDLLFENQHDYTQEKLTQLAAQIEGLDIDQFTQDLQSQATKDKVAQDLSQARQIGLNSTPTIFINGTKFTQPLSLANFKIVIEEILQTITPNPILDSTSDATPSAELNGTSSTNQ